MEEKKGQGTLYLVIGIATLSSSNNWCYICIL